MENSTERKINTEFLPEDWRQTLADEHNVSVATVEKIVYGQRRLTTKNLSIFKSALAMAEATKAEIDELHGRAAALTL